MRAPGKKLAYPNKRILIGLLFLVILSGAYVGSWTYFSSYNKLMPLIQEDVFDIANRSCTHNFLLLHVHPEGALSRKILEDLLSELADRNCNAGMATENLKGEFKSPEEIRSFIKGWIGTIFVPISISGPSGKGSPKVWHTSLKIGSSYGGEKGEGKIYHLFWNGTGWSKVSETAYGN